MGYELDVYNIVGSDFDFDAYGEVEALGQLFAVDLSMDVKKPAKDGSEWFRFYGLAMWNASAENYEDIKFDDMVPLLKNALLTNLFKLIRAYYEAN